MTEPAKKRASYNDLFGLPENMTGQIIDGELLATPRPSFRHTHASSALGGALINPFHFGGSGGPGGWVILDEPEIMIEDHLLVPDLAGWRRERFFPPARENWISISPDWVCEILSPSTLRVDKIRKMPIYAQSGVSFVWLIDPGARTLDVFQLQAGKWVLLSSFLENDKVRAEPFEEVEIELEKLWWE